MIRINLVVEGELERVLHEHVRAGGFDSAEAYVESMLADQLMTADPPDVEARVLEGLQSGPGIEATPEYWDNVRSDFAKRHGITTPR